MTNEEMNLMYHLWNENRKLKEAYGTKLGHWLLKEVSVFDAVYTCSECGNEDVVFSAGHPVICNKCGCVMNDDALQNRLHEVCEWIPKVKENE
jgi:ribosomal protein L37AE/L43A